MTAVKRFAALKAATLAKSQKNHMSYGESARDLCGVQAVGLFPLVTVMALIRTKACLQCLVKRLDPIMMLDLLAVLGGFNDLKIIVCSTI